MSESQDKGFPSNSSQHDEVFETLPAVEPNQTNHPIQVPYVSLLKNEKNNTHNIGIIGKSDSNTEKKQENPLLVSPAIVKEKSIHASESVFARNSSKNTPVKANPSKNSSAKGSSSVAFRKTSSSSYHYGGFDYCTDNSLFPEVDIIVGNTIFSPFENHDESISVTAKKDKKVSLFQCMREGKESSNKSGFGQWLTCLGQFLLFRRIQWLDTLAEIIIPLLFGIIITILWAVFPDRLTPGITDFNGSQPNLDSYDFWYRAGLCYDPSYSPATIDNSGSPNDPIPTGYEGFSYCQVFDDFFGIPYPAYCGFSGEATYNFDFLKYSYLNDDFDVDDPVNQELYPIDENKIPLRGLCSATNSITLLYVQQAMGQLSRLENLDMVIGMQWTFIMNPLLEDTRKKFNLDSNFAAMSGLVSNSAYSALQANGNIMFAPRANIPEELINFFYNNSKLFQYVFSRKHFIFDTVEDALEVAKSHKFGRTMAVIEIQQMDLNGLKMKLHMNKTAVPNMDRVVDSEYAGGYETDRAEMFYVSGMAALQQMVYQFYLSNPEYSGVTDYFHITPSNMYIDDLFADGVYRSFTMDDVKQIAQKSLLEAATAYSQGKTKTFSPMMAGMYSPDRSKPYLLIYASFLIAFFLSLCFFFSTAQISKRLVMDKETRITEAMLVMGLRYRNRLLAWFFELFVFFFVVSVLLSLTLVFTVLKNSNMFLVFLVIFLFGLTIIPLSGIFAALFNSVRSVTVFAPLVYFVMAIPYFLLYTPPGGAILAVSIFSPSAFGALVRPIFRWELGQGFSASKLNSPIDDPRTLYLLIFLLADLVLYTLLMLYLDAVVPKQWGTPKHPLFFILEPIKCCRKRCGCCKKDDQETDDDDTDEVQDGRDPEGVYEEETIPAGERSLDVQGLRKVFKRSGKEFVAVNDFCWMMPTGGISVLLGHNGAGKSTLMNMITGMTTCDGGDCRIVGYSIHDDLSMTRQKLGFCPQHNILWPDLTCRDHLEFYAKIKGVKGAKLEEAVQRILEAVDLVDKADYPSRALSGGQKRKLSVAVAFVGGSPLVLLDEPTAGMDVAARRHTWELLLKLSEDTSVLLTTHFMDEADLLGDRIAIMSAGRLMCSGSSLFLKSRLGVGYNITFAVTPETDVAALSQLVQDNLAGAKPLKCPRGEVGFRVPKARDEEFGDMFDMLDAEKETLGLLSYSLTTSSLEDVFLGVTQEKQDIDVAERQENIAEKCFTIWSCLMLTPGVSLYNQQLKACLRKRFFSCFRDRSVLFYQIIMPVFTVLFAMLLNLSFRYAKHAELDLSYSVYPEPIELQFAQCSDVFDVEWLQHFVSKNVFLNDVSLDVPDDYALWDELGISYYNHSRKRYGAVGCNNADALLKSGIYNSVTIFYNTSSFYEVAISTTQLYNFIVISASSSPNASISTTVASLPETQLDRDRSGVLQLFCVSLVSVAPFLILPSVTISWIVKESRIGARQLQNNAGLRAPIYWFAHFVFDLALYVVAGALIVIMLLIFQRDALVGKEAIGPFIATLALFGVSSILFSYCASFLFVDHGTAQNSVIAFGLLTGLVLNIFVFILSIIPQTEKGAVPLRYIFRISPFFAMMESSVNLGVFSAYWLQTNDTLTRWSKNMTIFPIIYLAADTLIFSIILWLCESCRGITRRCGFKRQSTKVYKSCVDENVDSDVEKMEREVLSVDEDPDRYILTTKHLQKVYTSGCFRKTPSTVAVKDLTFGIVPGEVFGLLGTNGAGKTTTISILCQELLPTAGEVNICGYDMAEEGREAMQCVGYCPQFDATLNLLTVEEHLRVFAGIRGIVPAQQETVINELIALCGLEAYRKVTSSALSGGNRRKLSFALSLVGGPPVVLLDEPSAGMDPVARRGLWTAIQGVSRRCSVLLTTHHLEEIEALADCVAMMVAGELRCIGSKTHLKTKFGTGFELSLRMRSGLEAAADFEENKQLVIEFMQTRFPEATLNEMRGQRCVYALPPDVRLPEVFLALQQEKERIGVTDYCISHTSLEQIFLQFGLERGGPESFL